jgi:hypothetical protein
MRFRVFYGETAVILLVLRLVTLDVTTLFSGVGEIEEV